MKLMACLLLAGTAWLAVELCGQQYSAPAGASGPPQPMNWTAEQDHQNMLDQLGIKVLAPGPERRRDESESGELR